jgi:hypothetical protein
MLGRTGVVYKADGVKYFINSEVLIAPPYDIVLYVDGIRYYDANQKDLPLSFTEKQRIAIEVKEELEYMGMRVELGM